MLDSVKSFIYYFLTLLFFLAILKRTNHKKIKVTINYKDIKMKHKITPSEKFRVWRYRTGIQYKDLARMIGHKISDNAVSMWMRGITKPKSYHRKVLYYMTKELAVEGKYKLVISSNDWFIRQMEEELFLGEILILWRERNNYTIRQMSEVVGLSTGVLSSAENGTLPSRETADVLEKHTEGLVSYDLWKKEYNDKDFF